MTTPEEIPEGMKAVDITGWQTLNIKPGDIVLLRCPEHTNMTRLGRSLGELQNRTGVEFVAIPFDFEVATVLRKVDA